MVIIDFAAVEMAWQLACCVRLPDDNAANAQGMRRQIQENRDSMSLLAAVFTGKHVKESYWNVDGLSFASDCRPET